MVYGLWFMVYGLWFSVQCSEFPPVSVAPLPHPPAISGLGFGVWGFGFPPASAAPLPPPPASSSRSRRGSNPQTLIPKALNCNASRVTSNKTNRFEGRSSQQPVHGGAQPLLHLPRRPLFWFNNYSRIWTGVTPPGSSGRQNLDIALKITLCPLTVTPNRRHIERVPIHRGAQPLLHLPRCALF